MTSFTEPIRGVGKVLDNRLHDDVRERLGLGYSVNFTHVPFSFLTVRARTRTRTHKRARARVFCTRPRTLFILRGAVHTRALVCSCFCSCSPYVGSCFARARERVCVYVCIGGAGGVGMTGWVRGESVTGGLSVR